MCDCVIVRNRNSVRDELYGRREGRTRSIRLPSILLSPFLSPLSSLLFSPGRFSSFLSHSLTITAKNLTRPCHSPIEILLPSMPRFTRFFHSRFSAAFPSATRHFSPVSRSTATIHSLHRAKGKDTDRVSPTCDRYVRVLTRFEAI